MSKSPVARDLLVHFEYAVLPVHQPHDSKKERDLWVALLLRSTADIVSDGRAGP